MPKTPGATNLHPEPLARERLRWRHHLSAQPVQGLGEVHHPEGLSRGYVRPALPPWDTVGMRFSEPVLSPPSPCLAAETEAAETKSAPDVSRGPLAAT